MSSPFDPVWQAMEAKVSSGWAPGMVAGIQYQGRTEYFATGVRTLGQPAAMRTGTPFRIASLSKPLAGALAVSMLADGALALDDPADIWLPELAFPRVLTRPDAPLSSTVAAEHEITVRQLLTLTHGLGATFEDTPLAQAMDMAGLSPGPFPPAMSGDDYMASIGSLPLAHQPGSRWSYHVGSEILSVLLARAGQAPLHEILKERITDPLGMESTGFFADSNELPSAYQTTANGLAAVDGPRGVFSQPPPFESLAGGLVSTVPDYLTFLRSLAENTLLPATLRAKMTSDQLTPGQKDGLKGFMGSGESWGWQISVETSATDATQKPWNATGRYGWTGGFGTTAYVDPSRDLIAVLFTQRLMNDPGEDFAYFWRPLIEALEPAANHADS